MHSCWVLTIIFPFSKIDGTWHNAQCSDCKSIRCQIEKLLERWTTYRIQKASFDSRNSIRGMNLFFFFFSVITMMHRQCIIAFVFFCPSIICQIITLFMLRNDIAMHTFFGQRLDDNSEYSIKNGNKFSVLVRLLHTHTFTQHKLCATNEQKKKLLVYFVYLSKFRKIEKSLECFEQTKCRQTCCDT